MELRHLRYFIATAEELHLGRAAQRLHMSQQPLSKQIRDLEAEIEVPLFHRTKRTMRLTEAGKVFLQEARKTLTQANHAISTAQQVGRGEVGQLQVGFTGPILNSILPTVVRQFRIEYPSVHLGLKRLQTNEQVAALLSGEIDIGLLHPPINAPLITQETIDREPLVVALPSNHLLAANAPEPISAQALANESFILFPRHVGPILYDAIVGFCRQMGFSPDVVQEAFPQQTILGLVAAGLGISMIHASAQAVQQRDVVIRPLVEITPTLSSAIAWVSETAHPALPQFLTTVRSVTSL